MTEPASTAPPPALRDRVDAVERALSAAAGLVLCSDFDGTLAPIHADPDAPELPEERRSLLADLAAHPAVEVALVSGRSLSDLTGRADVDGASYVGNHGVERRRDGERVVPPEAADREVVARAVGALGERLDDVEGCEVEDKGPSLTVHYREVDESEVPRVREAARTVAGAADGLDLFEGKQVYELRPAAVDKGTAVASRAERRPDDWLTAYLGDDTSDEAAFRALGPGDLPVLVGDRRRTAARYRLADPAAVESFLRWLRRDGLRALE